MSVRQYRKYTCSTCNKTAKEVSVSDRLSLGNPLFKCQHCGALNYDKFILEPALLDPQELIKDAKKQHNNLLIWLALGVAAFFMLMLLTGSPVIGIVVAGVLFVLLTSSDSKKKNSISTDQFSKEINESLARLNADRSYADLVIKIQGNHPNSAWSAKANH